MGQDKLKEIGPKLESRKAQLNIHVEDLGSSNPRKELRKERS